MQRWFRGTRLVVRREKRHVFRSVRHLYQNPGKCWRWYIKTLVADLEADWFGVACAGASLFAMVMGLLMAAIGPHP